MKRQPLTNIRRIIVSHFLLFAILQLHSQEKTSSDKIVGNNSFSDTVQSKTKNKDTFWNRLIHSNIDRTFEKKIDISYAAAPSYTREASFGIGGMATGLYRLDRTDSIAPPSDITLVFNASVRGFFALEARGNNYFKENKALLSYEVYIIIEKGSTFYLKSIPFRKDFQRT